MDARDYSFPKLAYKSAWGCGIHAIHLFQSFNFKGSLMKRLHLVLPLALCFQFTACNSPKKVDKQPNPPENQVSFETIKQAPEASDSGDEPATDADIERLYQVLKIRDQIKQITEIMSHQIRQMIQEAMKGQPNLPPDTDKRLGALYEKIMKNMPTEELLQAMTPIYEKYFTRSDIHAIVTFYSSPAGKKMVNQTPEITQEAIQASMTIMQNYMKQAMEEVYDTLNELQKEALKGLLQQPQEKQKAETADTDSEDEATTQEDDREENP